MNRAGSDLREHLEEAGEARADGVSAAQLDPFARGYARDRTEHRQAMVTTGIDDAAPQARRNSSDPESVARRANVAADAPELLRDGFDPIRLLRAELPGAPDHGLAASVTCGDREQGKLVDERGHVSGRHCRAD
jgi:hypothetical protein